MKAESLNDVVYPEFINPIEKVNHDVYDLKKNARTEKNGTFWIIGRCEITRWVWDISFYKGI